MIGLPARACRSKLSTEPRKRPAHDRASIDRPGGGSPSRIYARPPLEIALGREDPHRARGAGSPRGHRARDQPAQGEAAGPGRDPRRPRARPQRNPGRLSRRDRHRNSGLHRYHREPRRRNDHGCPLQGRPDRQKGRPPGHHRSAAVCRCARAGAGAARRAIRRCSRTHASISFATRTPIKEHAIPEQQLATQQATVEQDEATVKLDQGNLAAAQVNVDYTRITSPIDGRVGLRNIDPGNIVTANGTTGLCVITQIQPITVIFTIAEDELAEVTAQMASRPERCKCWRSTARKPHQLATGTLLTVDNQVNTTTGTVRAPGDIPEYPERAVSESIRERAAPGQDLARRRPRAAGGDSAQQRSGLRLCGAARQHGEVASTSRSWRPRARPRP